MTKEVHVTAATVKRMMQQRLTRGTQVKIADSFGKANLRGVTMIVASKGTVKCNKGGRCAGDWCQGLAVFLTAPSDSGEDKQMGWRKDTVKVCLTHLKTDQGALLMPPTDLSIPTPSITRCQGPSETEAQVSNGSEPHVTWSDLADAHSSGNLDRLAFLARKLKSENDDLFRRVVETQDKLLRTYTKE